MSSIALYDCYYFANNKPVVFAYGITSKHGKKLLAQFVKENRFMKVNIAYHGDVIFDLYSVNCTIGDCAKTDTRYASRYHKKESKPKTTTKEVVGITFKL